MKTAFAAALLALSLPAALAQYKVVGPDGRVTYTDRPPTGSAASPGGVGATASGAAPAADAGSGLAALPYALRQVAGRFPVTLYTVPACPPCDSGRELLRQRGIPFEERTAGENDRAAWERAVGSTQAPVLAVGQQMLHGFSPENWQPYLDTAGYPQSSQLPPGWKPAAPRPLVPRAAAAAPAAPAQPAAPRPEAPPPVAPGGFRF